MLIIPLRGMCLPHTVIHFDIETSQMAIEDALLKITSPFYEKGHRVEEPEEDTSMKSEPS